ncbi:MAG: oligopeptide/dipeptide ABC transporter ATP-binding protein [Acidimicrobiia bacterium]
MSLVRVEGLRKSFQRGRSEVVHAVNDVSFSIERGETLALIGESGSGKSTVGRLLLRLLDADQGEVMIDGVNLMSLDRESLRRRRSEMQVVFQEPYESLNPRMKIGDIVAEPIRIHEPKLSRSSRVSRVLAALSEVGLASEYADRYARSMSGGQQQRVGIARALVSRPKLLVLDEPTSSLDLSVQAQILEILHALQQDHHMAYLYISHDLSTVQYIANRVAVMYLGQIREIGTVDEIVGASADPYTRTLLNAFLDPDPTVRNSTYAPPMGEIPNPTQLPPGCFFQARCPERIEICTHGQTALLPYGDSGKHLVRCLRVQPGPALPSAS